jgi:hypothetical protein
MPWLDKNGNRYFYRSVREGTRVRSVYVGMGPMADLEALDADRAAWDRFAARLDRQDQREALRAVLGPLDRLAAVSDSAFRRVMIRAGCYQSDRHWRRRGMGRRTGEPRRGRTKSQGKPEAETPRPAAPEGGPVPQDGEFSEEQFRERFLLLAGEDPQAAAEFLARFLDSLPADRLDEAIRATGADLGRRAEEAVLGWTTAEPLTREFQRRWLARLRTEVAGPQPTAIEEILAHRVALSYAVASEGDAQAARLSDAGGATMRQVMHWHEVSDRGHRRLLSAVRTLALVRRLALPAPPPVQVNVTVPAPAAPEGNGAGPGADLAGLLTDRRSRLAAAGLGEAN